MVYSAESSTGDGPYTIVLATLERALSALSSPETARPFCGVGGLAAGGGRACFSVEARISDAGANTPYDDQVYVDVEAQINSQVSPAHSIQRAAGSGSARTLINRTTLAVLVQPSAWIEVREGSRLRILRGPANPQGMLLVGHDVIWESWAGLRVEGVYRGNIDADPTLLFRPADGSDLTGFVTDGVDMAWAQSYEPTTTGPAPFARTELWTASYTLDSGAISPRKVRDLDYQPVASQLVGQGYYAFRSPTGAQVVRLSDGQRRVLPVDPNWRHYDIAWLTQGEVAITVMRLETLGPLQRTLMRMPIDSIPLAL